MYPQKAAIPRQQGGRTREGTFRETKRNAQRGIDAPDGTWDESGNLIPLRRREGATDGPSMVAAYSRRAAEGSEAEED